MEKKGIMTAVKKDAPLWLFVVLGTYIITGILLMLLAFLVYRFGLGEKAVDIAIVVIYVMVNFIAGFFMGRKKKVKKYLAGFGIGMFYFIVLIIVSLICNHGLQDFAGNFFTTMAVCVGAGTLGGMLS